MAHTQFHAVLQQIRKLLGARRAEEETDGGLLERFARGQDQSAFATLMARHGPMVLGVCRRILQDEHDAEDVFQAAFIVLARRARSLDGAGSVAGWLYTVAYRLALRARAGTARRRARERQAADMLPPKPCSERVEHDLRSVLDEALQALPEKYRLPLVLCYLEGKTTEEAARQLGCPFGTVSSRLARGKDLLRQRLTRRGLALSAGALAAALAPEALTAAVPASLMTPTLQAATLIAAGQAASGAGLSASVVALVEGAFRDMLLAKVKTAVVMVLAVALLAVGTGVVRSLTRADALEDAAPPAAGGAEKPPPVDTLGDPLPPGALARIGTLRLQHESGVPRCCFAPDGRTLATGGNNGSVRLWDVARGKELRVFRGHTADIRGLAFSPDGKTLASASWDATVRLWDVASGKELHLLGPHANPVLCVAFTPDGKSVISGDRGKELRRWDTTTGRELAGFVGHEQFVYSLGFSPDGRTMFSVGMDHTVRLWEMATGKERHKMTLPAETRSAAVSPDGKFVAVDLSDKTVHLLEVPSGKVLYKLPGHEPFTYQMAFSPDGQTFISSSYDQVLRLWDVASGKKILETREGGMAVAAAFSPDNKLLATGSDTAIQFWDACTGQAQAKVAMLQPIKVVSLSPDGKTLATAGTEKVVRLWEADTGKEIRALSGHTAEVSALAFAPDGKTLASATADGTVRHWDLAGKELAQWSGHVSGVTSLAFSRDGRILATGGADKAIRLWDVGSHKEIRVLSGHEQSVTALAFGPDGKMLVSSGGTDCTVRVWDTAEGKELRQLVKRPVATGRGENAKRRLAVVTGLALSADGTIVAVSADTYPVRLFKTATGEELPSLNGNDSGRPTILAFSPDGKTLATGVWGSVAGTANQVRLWDIGTGKMTREFSGHAKSLTSLSFSADGKRLATGSYDRTALVWDLSRPAAD